MCPHQNYFVIYQFIYLVFSKYIIIIIIHSLELFTSAMVFHWSLSNSKSSQVSRTFLSILAVRNNAVVWIVSTRPPTFKSSSSFSNPFVTVPNAHITIGIIVTYTFHGCFNFLARLRYLFFFSILSVLFCGQPGQQSRLFCKFSFFFVDY